MNGFDIFQYWDKAAASIALAGVGGLCFLLRDSLMGKSADKIHDKRLNSLEKGQADQAKEIDEIKSKQNFMDATLVSIKEDTRMIKNHLMGGGK